jgi:hypothetical protein
MTDRRYPHLPFDPSLIDGFLRGRELVAADLIPAGKCNTNYRLLLADGGTYVLRLRSRGDADREAYAMGLVRDLVPVPLEVERGPGWSLYTFLAGDQLAEAPEHCGRAAEALARIASVEFASSGWVNADGTVSPFDFGGYSDTEDGGDFMAAMLARTDVRAWIGEEAEEAVRAILNRESGRMKELDGIVRLVHGDFNPTNILIHRGEVSGVVDWEFAHAGSPYMDIGNLLRHTDESLHDRIREGLIAGGFPLRRDWKTIAELIDVSSQVEFLTSACSDDFKRTCVARIERFIAKYR